MELNLETTALETETMWFFPLILMYSVFLSSIIRYIYIKFSVQISEKNLFSLNFIFLSLIVTLIITVVKSSLALSLGLVGALSIVRFRTAIKNPEELIFLFLCIGIGIGLGANQIFLVSCAVITFIVVYVYMSFKRTSFFGDTFLVTLHSDLDINLHEIESYLKKHKLNLVFHNINLSVGTQLNLKGQIEPKDFVRFTDWIKTKDPNCKTNMSRLLTSD